jgi:hypothetical protein
MYAFPKDKARSYTAHNSGFSRQGESLANAIHGFNARAVCTDQICYLEIFHLIGSPIQLLIRRLKKV